MTATTLRKEVTKGDELCHWISSENRVNDNSLRKELILEQTDVDYYNKDCVCGVCLPFTNTAISFQTEMIGSKINKTLNAKE